MGQNEEQEPDTQIRSALKHVLAASEKQVPPTTDAILAAIRQEQPFPKGNANSDEAQDQQAELEPGILVPSMAAHPQTRRSSRRSSVIWQNIAAIAAVIIIILASVGLFSHRFFVPSSAVTGTPTAQNTPGQTTQPLHSPTPVASSSVTAPTAISSSTSVPTITPAPFDGWNRVALVTPGRVLANFNYLTDCCTTLDSTSLPASTIFDGVSQDGQNVMYHTVNNGTTVYYTQLSASKNVAVYTFKGNGGNAIWLNSTYALITTFSSVIAVNVQAGTATTYLPSLMASHLNFFRTPYLYFTGGADRNADALYRIDINTGAVQQITFGSMGATFWLSPDGTTVYFVNTIGSAGNSGIYAVNSDGSNMHLLRQYPYGTPIGYAADNALIIMRVVNGAFQVLKLGATAQQDQIELNNAAPGAIALCKTTSVGADPICAGDFALAPYGYALIAQGLYANGTYKVWSSDLTTGKQMAVPSLSSVHTPIQLIGWDKIPTP